MNQYQKIATFGVRVAGATIALVGAVGPITVAVADFFDAALTVVPSRQWLGSAAWFVAGVVLMFSAKRIGSLLGRGLD